MGMVIKNDASAVHILNCMQRNENALTKSMEKLSSGMRLNGAADDPSAYAIAIRMDVRVASINRQIENAQRSSSMFKTAGGALEATTDILRTLKERAIQAANGTCSDEDRGIIQKEFDQLIDQINDNSEVQFNGKALLNGSLSGAAKAPVANVFSNEALAEGTRFQDLLTALLDRNENPLDIKASDTVKISFVRDGQTLTTSFQVSNNTLEDIFKKANAAAGTEVFDERALASPVAGGSFVGVDATGNSVYTADGKDVLSVKAAAAGVSGAISGFAISVSGVDGNVKKRINEKLDAFSERIVAADRSADNSVVTQIGSKSNQVIRTSLGDASAKALGLQGTDPETGVVKNIDVRTQENANAAIKVLDNAVKTTLDQQTTIGAVQNRLQYTIENLTTEAENLTAAASTIRDANLAKEMTEFTRNNILMQASQAMLAQLNQNSSNILQLLR